MSKILLSKLNKSLDNGELLKIVADALAASQVLAKMGYSAKGQYVKLVKEFLNENKVPIDHWTPNGRPITEVISKKCPVCNSVFSDKKYIIEDQTTCSVSCANTYFRSGKDNPNYIDGKTSYRKLAISKLGAFCGECGYNSNEKVLEVHHIDKDRSNNNISNLIVLCANCHKLKHY